jgi:ATP-dependent helicase/nuclease subunit B
LDNPFVEQVGSDEEVERALLRALRPKGGINASDEAINAIDRDIVTGDDSDVAVLKRNKDGSWSKNSEVLTEEEFEVMTSFVRQKALQTGEDISNGKIDVLPYKKGDKSGCDYCPYKGICGFDSSLEGYDYQKMDGKLKPEDAFVWMKEKLNRKGEEDA